MTAKQQGFNYALTLPTASLLGRVTDLQYFEA